MCNFNAPAYVCSFQRAGHWGDVVLHRIASGQWGENRRRRNECARLRPNNHSMRTDLIYNEREVP